MNDIDKNVFAGLPRLAQDSTPDQVEAVVAYLVNLPLRELRQRQQTHGQQIDLAYKQGRMDILLSEQWKFDMTTDAVSRQTFDRPQPGLHSGGK